MLIVPKVQMDQILVTSVDVNSFSLYIQPSALHLSKSKSKDIGGNNDKIMISNNYTSNNVQTS